MVPRKSKRRHLPLLAAIASIALMTLSGAIPAFANYPDGFDTYTTNTINPGPWTFNPDSGVCWTGKVLTGTQNSVNPLSPPNMYGIAFANGCSGTLHSSYLEVGANATSNILNFTFYANLDAQPLTPSTDSLNLIICGTTEQLFVNGTSSGNSFILLSSILYWTKISATQFVTVGGTCTGGVQIEVTSVAGNSGSYRVDIDNTNMLGANAINSGANFFLINYATQTWFPISTFPDSNLRINYNQAVTCATYNMIQASPEVCLSQAPLNIPDLSLQLSHATLVTLNLNGSIPYTRTIIPQPNALNSTTPTSQRMYLDIPQACPSICSYQLTINDFTNFYPAGTTSSFINQGSFVITSTPTDGQSIIAMTMQPGVYNLTLISADRQHSVTMPLSLTAANNAPSLNIQNGSAPITIGPFQQFSYSATWDCDLGGISSTVTDSEGTMTHEVFQLWRYNVTNPGGVLIYSNAQSHTGAPGFSVSYDFRNATIGTNNLNSSLSNEYKVAYQLTTPDGIQPYGQFGVSNSKSCSHVPNATGASGAFSLSTDVLGLGQIFAIKNAYEAIISLVVIVFTVGIMAARMSHMSMLVMGGEVGIFTLMTWLPPVAGVLCPIFLFIGALGVMENRIRRPIT